MLRFNEKLHKLTSEVNEETDLVEKLKQELIEANERQKRIEELRIAEKANFDNEMANKLAVFKSRFNPLLNGRAQFNVRYSENKASLEIFLAPDRIVARFGKDAQGMPFSSLGGEISGMTKKEDVDLSALKPQIYNLMESIFQ